MYSLEDEDDSKSNLVHDEPITDGYEDDSDSDEQLEQWKVAPEHLRPWEPFEPELQSTTPLWPVPSIADLSVGALLGGHVQVRFTVCIACYGIWCCALYGVRGRCQSDRA